MCHNPGHCLPFYLTFTKSLKVIELCPWIVSVLSLEHVYYVTFADPEGGGQGSDPSQKITKI